MIRFLPEAIPGALVMSAFDPIGFASSGDMAADILQAASRLRAVFPVPETLGEPNRVSADAALDGFAIVHYQGEHHVPLRRSTVDWVESPGILSQTEHFVFRTSFIADLAQAWHILGDARYAVAARDYLDEYMRCWPSDAVGKDKVADSTLTLCIRNAIWARSLHLLVNSEAFDTGFTARVVAFIAAQFEWLRHHMSSTINWRVSNARNLLTGSLYLAFHDRAADWRQHAVRVLNDAWCRQVLPDGVHAECNPVYHIGMANTFRELYRIGRELPALGLTMTRDRLAPMYDFALACVKPNGYLCGIHDSQSEFTGHLHDGVHTTSHKGVDNTRAWKEFRQESGLTMDRPPTSQVFPDAGLAFVRTGWDEDALWMSFDATQWGGGHCHLSRNAIQLHALRQSMVIDPGWLSYESNEWGIYGRTTRAHSTCNLNGLNQSATNPSRLQSFSAPGYDALFSVYEGGYWDTELKWTFTHADRGIWAQHARMLFRVGERFAFVADSMFRLPRRPEDPEAERPAFECVWQLAPGAAVSLQPERYRAVAQWRDAGLLLLNPIRPEGAVYEEHTAETSPLRGWAPGEGEHHPAPQIVFNTPRMDRQHDYFVSVLVPFAGASAPGVSVEAKSPQGQTGHVLLTWADGSRDEIYWGCNFGMMLGTQPGFETDSSLVHLRKDATGKVTGGCCVNGTYIEPFSPAMREVPETFVF